MHEESLVKALLSQAAEIATAHAARNVDVIEVEIGPLSGVEELLLQSAFERLTSDSEFADTRLQIRQVPLTLVCRHCSHETHTHELKFACDSCGGNQVRIVRGDEFRLLSLELAAPADAETDLQRDRTSTDVAADSAATI